MILINILLILLVFIIAAISLLYYVKKNQNAEVEKEVDQDDQTYTLDKMREYVKKRLDEISSILTQMTFFQPHFQHQWLQLNH